MRVQLIGCVTAAMLGVGAMAWAQTQDAKSAEILAKTRNALGGKKLDTLKGLSVEAAMSRNMNNMQMSSGVELLLEMPDKYVRTEETRSGMGMTISNGFNGDKAIMPAGAGMQGGAMVFRMGPGGMVPADGPKPTPEEQAAMNKAAARAQKVEISRMMLGWFGTAHPALTVSYTYAGEAESPDGKAFVIDVKDTDGFDARLFIDQNNYLPLMVSYQGRAPRMMTAGGPMVAQTGGASTTTQVQRPTRELTEEERKKLAADTEKHLAQALQQSPMVDISLFFDDWREVDGIQFPHVMRRASAGATTEEWTINKVKVNPKIDAKKFAVDTK